MGGSNSVFRDGWVSFLSPVVSDPVRNLSVGASTSLCGLYRALLPDGPQAGDTIIWEYALNEAVHVRRRYALEPVLKNTEHLLRLAASRGWRFVPIILMPRSDAQRPERPEYYDQVIGLFREYGVEPLDITASLCAALRVPSLGDQHYSDSMHLVRSAEVMGHLAERAGAALTEASIPQRAMPIRTGGRVPTLLAFRQPGRFENSIMSLPVAAAPLRLRLAGSGAVLSVVCVCRPELQQGLRVSLMRGGELAADARVSTTSAKSMHLLKPVALEQIAGTAWEFGPDDRLVLRPLRRGGRVHAEQGLLPRLADLTSDDYPSIAGVLAEMDPPDAPAGSHAVPDHLDQLAEVDGTMPGRAS